MDKAKLINKLSSVAHVFRRIFDLFPIGPTGAIIAVVCFVGIFHYGRGKADYILYTAGIFGLGVLVIAMVFTIGGAIYVAVLTHKKTRQEIDTCVGVQVKTGYYFPSLTFLPFLSVTETWVRPKDVIVEAHETWRGFEERVTFSGRGKFDYVIRRFFVSDIFGLSSIGFYRVFPATIRVEPGLANIGFDISFRDVSREGYSHPHGEKVGDMVEMRHYAPGDPLKIILWKAFAKSQRLIVREAEKSIAPEQSTVACFVSGPNDEPSASTAKAFLMSGLMGADFTFLADGGECPVKTVNEAIEQIILSINFRDNGGECLFRILNKVGIDKMSRCVIFLPSGFGGWYKKLSTFVTMLPTPPTFVVSLDISLEELKPSIRFIFFGERKISKDLADFMETLQNLSKLDGDLKVIQVRTGLPLTPTEVESLKHWIAEKTI